MYCPNCGKEIKDSDNFCRFCGADLRLENAENVEIAEIAEPVEVVRPEIIDSDEEYVLYDVKKHWMSLFWTFFLTPCFLFYFWTIFLNTHSFLSWVVAIALLGLIFYPVARYKSDKIVITNKAAHIKVGVLNPEEKEIPVNDLSSIKVSQSFLGQAFNYGNVVIEDMRQSMDYGYIQTPEDLEYIIEDTQEFIKEALEN